ncbi:hypothetical protein ES689_07640 [Frigoribacterium sp. ACAM 257]|uniref:hypothetical protein n=1 Tax=Frigoribacterium sp. ACAM 257 TaxID=2508998 RepID=UPI0011B99685|nr:hypothetical protein [Frigoribacterium sp. ACAM 257]TWX38498.1 hypothetical protein ES689_07640 [Frigoribacterium sp. ACAM 257]
MTTNGAGSRTGRASRGARAATAVTTAVLAAGVLTGCGERDDPVVTPSPTPVSPTATPEPATPEPTLEVPVTTDKPTDRETIPPQN